MLKKLLILIFIPFLLCACGVKGVNRFSEGKVQTTPPDVKGVNEGLQNPIYTVFLPGWGGVRWGDKHLKLHHQGLGNIFRKEKIANLNPQAKKNIITFSSWGSITEVEVLKHIISDFERENPDIKVNFIHIPQNYFQKIHLLFASSQAPDVIFINNLNLPLYASKLEDLTEWVDKNAYYPQSIEALSFEGKLLAIPRDVSTLVFYRNKSLIKKTPNNLEELSHALANSPKYGISYERDVYFMFPYVLSMGEDIYNPQKSLEFYKSLEGKYAPTPSEIGSLTLAQMFMDGKIGLYLSGRWLNKKISENAKFDWDVILFPGIVPLDASGWAVSKDSKNKENAEKFVKYLSSEASSEYFMNTGLIVPARIGVSKKIDNKAFLEAISKSKPLSVDKNYRKKIDRMNKHFFNI